MQTTAQKGRQFNFNGETKRNVEAGVKKRHPKIFHCVLFGRVVLFFHRWPEKEFIKYVGKHFHIEAEITDSNGYTREVGSGASHQIIVWTRPGIGATGTLLHECIHTTSIILDNAGVKADFKNDELVAYYSQMLFNFAVR